ncbi:MAG TPA: exo-beta-N-acetylmuramidase NamZ domain-containing protein [Verrucomicrobiales bacterium]|nr:exo-beta-N-acetylmuramidase NamZ domain-containing protein [Verrucomicrobiales bacterium]
MSIFGFLCRVLVCGLLFNSMAAAAIDESLMPPIRKAINEAVTAHQIPGAVLWMERGTAKCEAFGNRMVDPRTEAMTKDTIFDAASLTKVMATAPSIMLLIQDGKLKLDAPVCSIIPEFTGGGKETVTIKHLLTHTSGTRSGIPRENLGSNYKECIAAAVAEPLRNPVGARFLYSDINYILLGEVVRKVSGSRIDEFAAARIFRPLGMVDTGFLPSRRKLSRIAPTTREADGLVHGVVHDPTSRRMGGVAGHAGVFTTARDLAVYCRMLLSGGKSPSGKTIMTPATVKLMTQPNRLPGGVIRGLGWDMQSYYSDIKGDIFGPRSYGHTGWTGTAFWIDPQAEAFVILLTNRNHPTEEGSTRDLRIKVSTLAAVAMGIVRKPLAGISTLNDPAPAAAPPRTMNGIDVLEARGFADLQGLRVGLITNHTGQNLAGKSTIDVLAKAPGVKLVSLFSPEHGIRGTEDREGINDSIDEATGLPVHSLYGKTKRPLPEQLNDIDALVFDIQDIGCRFYTYVSTMLECMKAADESGRSFFVLDRINPINGVTVDGPLSEGKPTFVACHPIPLRHGMTVGELAKLFAADLKMKLHLTVVPVTGWDRRKDFAAAGMKWVNPSPNMRSVDAAMLYPGVALMEFCNVSVGRGTDAPFLLFGAPWIDGEKLAAALDTEKLPGLKISAAEFTPNASKFKGELCKGVRFSVQDRASIQTVRTGIALATATQKLHTDKLELDPMQKLLLHPAALTSIREGQPVEKTMALWTGELAEFKKRRAAVLLYPES